MARFNFGRGHHDSKLEANIAVNRSSRSEYNFGDLYDTASASVNVKDSLDSPPKGQSRSSQERSALPHVEHSIQEPKVMTHQNFIMADAAPISPTMPTIRDQVFVSYSHRDAEWLKRLQIMLMPLIRGGTIDLWDDTRI